MPRRVSSQSPACAQSSRGNDRPGKDRTVVERAVHEAMHRARTVALQDPSGPHETNSWARAGTPPLLAPLWLEYSRSVAQLFASSMTFLLIKILWASVLQSEKK